jgi:hypothetical protein
MAMEFVCHSPAIRRYVGLSKGRVVSAGAIKSCDNCVICEVANER